MVSADYILGETCKCFHGVFVVRYQEGVLAEVIIDSFYVRPGHS